MLLYLMIGEKITSIKYTFVSVCLYWSFSNLKVVFFKNPFIKISTYMCKHGLKDNYNIINCQNLKERSSLVLKYNVNFFLFSFFRSAACPGSPRRKKVSHFTCEHNGILSNSTLICVRIVDYLLPFLLFYLHQVYKF